ncbi:MAG: S-layer homology domain-containing protein [Clostridia bacterium]|nr:S-layer homology domain-containing protein [Clostridia bacterium]
MKRIIAVVAAVSLLCSMSALAADGVSRYQRQPESFDGSSMKYEPYDIKTLDQLIDKGQELLNKTGNDEKMFELSNEMYSEYTKASYASTVAQLMADRYYDANDDTAEKAQKTEIDVHEKLTNFFEKAYESGYSKVLCEIFGMEEDELEEYMENIPTEHFYELSRRETELMNKYSELYNNDSNACANLFIELVGVRNEMARECGYDNYAEYAHEMIYGRDYSEKEIETFSDAVAAYITPVMMGLTGMSMSIENCYKGMREDELISAVGDMFYDIDNELGSSFRFMTENSLYDIELRDNKNTSQGAYTVLLSGKGVPYLFTSDTEDDVWHVTTFIHESGHACALMHTPYIDQPWSEYMTTMSVDTCEIQSQGLEMLSEHRFGRLFGSAASYARYLVSSSIVMSIVDGCFYNEWQTRIYSEKDPTVDKANAIAAELLDKYYGIKDFKNDDAREIWVSVPHNFVAPMYYVSYAVSAAEALYIYALSLEDNDSAVEKYMQLSALGAFVPLKEAVADAELDDIFEPETIVRISEAIAYDAGLAYTDIDADAWYVPYFVETTHITDGRTDSEFMPDAAITRGEFIELLGKMYEYYEEDIDNIGTVTFNDVDADSEDVKYIAWAEKNGIINGYSESEFGYNDEITREQLVTMLSRIDGDYVGTDVLISYTDAEAVSFWADGAMSWAVTNGIINGRDGNMLAPQDNTTRAEAAKIAACYIKAEY